MSRLLPLLKGHPGRYVEPFAGSACVFFALAPKAAILGDINESLIELYLSVRKHPREIHRRLIAIPQTKATYYRWRAFDPSALDSQTRAVRFMYLNRNCFNGIYRTNIDDDFNVPYGRKVGAYPSVDDMLACAQLLRRASLAATDFRNLANVVKTGDIVYLDPPYVLESRRGFAEYGHDSFGLADLQRLSEALTKMHRAGAKFVVSYADCRAARKLGQPWISRPVTVRRNVAGFAGARRMAREWIITNLERVALD